MRGKGGGAQGRMEQDGAPPPARRRRKTYATARVCKRFSLFLRPFSMPRRRSTTAKTSTPEQTHLRQRSAYHTKEAQLAWAWDAGLGTKAVAAEDTGDPPTPHPDA